MSQPAADSHGTTSSNRARKECEIATAILEHLGHSGGRLDEIDISGLKARFPGNEGHVEAQVAQLRLQSLRQTSLGPYRIVRRIGSGSSGDVFEAVDSRLGRRVALKVLRNSSTARDLAIEREGRALASLEHPNIARIHALDEAQGLRFLVMEVVDGATLGQVVDACRRWPVDGAGADGGPGIREILDEIDSPDPDTTPQGVGSPRTNAPQLPGGRYFREIANSMAGVCDALHFAHARDLVHRDVKPANIIIDRDGMAKVTDFGLAKRQDLLRLSQTGVFVGTPYYASPEQASARKQVGPPSDIWSTGATLYELVTLEVPFRGPSEADVFGAILQGRYMPPRIKNPKIPSDLERIIVRCLELHPELRYPTARDLAVDLRRFAVGEALGLRSVGWLSRVAAGTRHPTRRTIGMALLSAVLCIGIGGAFGLSTFERVWDRNATCLQLLDEARHRFDEGMKLRDTQKLQQAIELTRRAVALRPDHAPTRQENLLVEGLVAYEQTDDTRAAEFLNAARECGPLTPEGQLCLARAQFAAHRLQEACSTFESLPPGFDECAAKDGVTLVGAFLQGQAVAPRLAKCIPAGALRGLGPNAVLGITAEPEFPRELRLFPNGLRHESHVWSIATAVSIGDAGDIAIATFAGRESHLVVLGTDRLYVGGPPFGPDGPRVWTELDDPVVKSCPGDSAGVSQVYKTHRHVAVIEAPAGSGTHLINSRHQGVGSTLCRQDGTSERGCAADWALGSQVHVLRRIELTDGPALVIGLGEHRSFTVNVARPAAGPSLDRLAFATLGAAQDAVALRVGEQDIVLIAVGGMHNGRSTAIFGRASPQGWEYGVHAFRLDRALGGLTIAASLLLPCPLKKSVVRLHAIDLLDDRTNEVVLAETIFDLDHDEPVIHRSHVMTCSDADYPALQERLRLPGAVVGAIPLDGGGVDLLISLMGQQQKVVTLRR